MRLKLWQEFKDFAFKGNMIELAVAVVIGAAFGKVVDALVKNMIMPILSYVVPEQASYLQWHIGRVQIGAFLGELVNFLIIALAVFLVIKKLVETVVKRAAPFIPSEPTTKECPFCVSTIPIKAVRCGHCTADLPALARAAPAVNRPPPKRPHFLPLPSGEHLRRAAERIEKLTDFFSAQPTANEAPATPQESRAPEILPRRKAS